MIYCFSPIISKDTTLLVLGSMPGEESLRKQEYYGHNRNQFWRIIFSIFNKPYTEQYDKKTSILLKHNIGLWDVINRCEREGSLDSKIKNEIPNDFEDLFEEYPNIKYIVFNGTKAMNSFEKYIKSTQYPNIKFLQMPSTSPANTITFEKKLSEWRIIQKLVE